MNSERSAPDVTIGSEDTLSDASEVEKLLGFFGSPASNVMDSIEKSGLYTAISGSAVTDPAVAGRVPPRSASVGMEGV